MAKKFGVFEEERALGDSKERTYPKKGHLFFWIGENKKVVVLTRVITDKSNLPQDKAAKPIVSFLGSVTKEQVEKMGYIKNNKLDIRALEKLTPSAIRSMAAN